MVAASRYSRRLMARGAVFALIAAAFIAVSGLPAQAQTYYYYTYPATPYYQSDCSTFSFGGLSYTSCSNPSTVYYQPAPTYYGYPYDNYYYPPDNYYTRNYYYYYGP